MRILMVTSECVPFAKAGGLGDAVPALAAALGEKGHDVRIIMPRYGHIPKETLPQHPAPLGVPLGRDGELWCAVREGALPSPAGGVKVYFLERDDLFGRRGIYGPDGSHSWEDNPRRFAFLAAGVFPLCRHLHWYPHIIHAHDWPAAPVPFLLAAEAGPEDFPHTASVFTIHNLGYQGQFSLEEAAYLPAKEGAVLQRGGQRQGLLNFLALGLENAQALTTVSPRYAREILDKSQGEGVEDILRRRQKLLKGVLNGMDYHSWDPAADPALTPHNYHIGNRQGKAALKARLQQEAGLPIEPDIPLFGMVARLTGQKGLDLLTGKNGALERILPQGKAQVFVLGSGEKKYEDALKKLAARYPSFLAAAVTFDEELARRIEGGGDFFLMPSLYEPCGLNQMYSLRYGTLPVARKTGGLGDSIRDIAKHPLRGTGILFGPPSPGALAEAMERAWKLYQNKPRLARVQQRGMALRFSWQRAAGEYEKIYHLAQKEGR